MTYKNNALLIAAIVLTALLNIKDTVGAPSVLQPYCPSYERKCPCTEEMYMGWGSAASSTGSAQLADSSKCRTSDSLNFGSSSSSIAETTTCDKNQQASDFYYNDDSDSESEHLTDSAYDNSARDGSYGIYNEDRYNEENGGYSGSCGSYNGGGCNGMNGQGCDSWGNEGYCSKNEGGSNGNYGEGYGSWGNGEGSYGCGGTGYNGGSGSAGGSDVYTEQCSPVCAQTSDCGDTCYTTSCEPIQCSDGGQVNNRVADLSLAAQ